jgi:hypothetical protein
MQSTKPVATPHHIDTDITEDVFPDAYPTEGPGKPNLAPTTSTILTQCIPLTQEHFSDMAGRFPYKSFKASQYMLIMYCTDAN